jgi:hypothetical protein
MRFEQPQCLSDRSATYLEPLGDFTLYKTVPRSERPVAYSFSYSITDKIDQRATVLDRQARFV